MTRSTQTDGRRVLLPRRTGWSSPQIHPDPGETRDFSVSPCYGSRGGVWPSSRCALPARSETTHLTRDIRAKSGRPPRANFSQFVRSLPEPASLLGLTHITSSYILRDILDDGCIAAQSYCPVLGEPVIYAFYGRAAFRGKIEFGPTNLACLFPTVLIIDPNSVPPPKYVFAFDSGAFVGGKMDRFLHPYMPLFDFLLAPEPVSAGRLVSAVFGTNDSFFRNSPRPEFQVPPSNFEADCYRHIVLEGIEDLDDRGTTPELVFADKIELRRSVKAVILPDVLAKDPEIHTPLDSYGLDIYDYPLVSYSRPVESHFTVRQIVESIYRRYGWL